MYILLGDGITEIFSAFGMILLMVITYTFEADAKQFLHQLSKKRTSDTLGINEDPGLGERLTHEMAAFP
jgi:hypothetical protein